jgi:succinate dehydrogenase / fumarate reductase cytochrome b subunit
MAATGLMLIGFLTSHLAGNFLLIEWLGGSKEKFNEYAHWLINLPFIIPMEIGLLAVFVIHIVSAIKVSRASRAARPEKYAYSRNLGKSTVFSRTMVKSGIVVLAFLVLHIITFKFGTEYYVDAQGNDITAAVEAAKNAPAEIAALTAESAKPVRDLYRTVIECFQQTWYSIIYIICMVVLAFHLAHGFQSAFKTFGFNHPKYNCCLVKLSYLIAAVYGIGYCLFPIYFGFIK